MDSLIFLRAVLLPLTENVGTVSRITELLDMLERTFLAVFRVDLGEGQPPSPLSSGAASTPASMSMDAGEEAKLLVVRAVIKFHRNAVASHRDFFVSPAYSAHASVFILELLKSIGGNSKQWFRALQLDSLEACLVIVEVIGEKSARLCLPGVVSTAVRYLRRASRGKDVTKVGCAVLKLLQATLTTSLASTEPAPWVRDTVTHLAERLRFILEPEVLPRSAYAPAMVCALRTFICSVLTVPVMAAYRTSPLASLLVVAFTVVENMNHLDHLGEDTIVTTTGLANPPDHAALKKVEQPASAAAVKQLVGVLSGDEALASIREALQCLRGVELLHVATTAIRLPMLRDRLLPVIPFHEEDTDDAAGALLLSVVRKCVRLVGTVVEQEVLYTHRRPRPYPAGVVDAFLFTLAGALARLPEEPLAAMMVNGRSGDTPPETVGERLTNALLEGYDAVLEDWDAYATHPAVLYVLPRLLLWQFHPAHAQLESDEWGKWCVGDLPLQPSCLRPLPSDFIVSGAFDQLWSVIAAPHLWDITQDEDLCSNQQVRHRQLVAAILLRFLGLTAELLALSRSFDGTDALERLFALTLYLVLEKATASGMVHETAQHCVETYSIAAAAPDALTFFLSHDSLLIDETRRAVRVEHLRPAAANVLRGSLAFVAERLIRRGAAEDGGRFSGCATQLTGVVRQRLSVTAMSAFFQRSGSNRVASLEDVAQVADFVSNTLHVAQDALRLCSRYDSADSVTEDIRGRRAALSLLRDGVDLAAYLNFCVPQEPLDEEKERTTTAAHTRVRALQLAVVEAIYAVLRHCTVHDAAASIAVQATVRGLTCVLTTSAAVNWADKVRQEQQEEAAERRRTRREALRQQRRLPAPTDGGDDEEDEESGLPSLPLAPLLNWPWTHYVEDAVQPTDAVAIEFPRSHLHTVYRVYLSFFAMLREPMAAFGSAAGGPGGRSGMERRRLGDVAVTPGVFDTMAGMEALRLLASEFLLHRMVSDVLPLVLLWHERSCTARIPTHTEERLRTATQQFVSHLFADCAEEAELREAMVAKCRGYPLLVAAVGERTEEPTAATLSTSLRNVVA